jgi:HEPN domain-containing protein
MLGLSSQKTHDLQALMLLIRNSGISVGQEIEQAATLTRFAVEARYPGEIEPITAEEVAQAIELAERSVRWARVQMYEVSGPR